MNVSDTQKRWITFGIALNKVLVAEIRPFVEQEIRKEYGDLKASKNIHTQSCTSRLQKHTVTLRYENINGNDTLPRKPGGKYDYPAFDYQVTSYIDFAKLYLENHMAKFNAFDEHCDASAVLTLLGKVPVFPSIVQTAAGIVKKARNAWAHCVFSDWNLVGFQKSFADMEQLVKFLGLPSVHETAILRELNDWQNKGVILCMNATVDPDLAKAVQQDLVALKNDVDKLAFEKEEEREKLKTVLQDNVTALEELARRVSKIEEDQSSLTAAVKITQSRMGELKSQQEDMYAQVCQLGETLGSRVDLAEHEQEIIKENQKTLCEKVDTTQDQISKLQSDQEDMERRVSHLRDQNSSNTQVSYEIASCEADITFFAERHDPDTRKWFLDDFHRWFENPGESRAYVLLGDAGVGKSVMAGALAQKSIKAGNFGAAYFCRHNDGTRNNPRYLLGTIAFQLCKCNVQYNSVVGGEGSIRKFLGNSEMGIQELFTKLLEEPLAKCNAFCERKLIVIDALDETNDESRKDFLDLIMYRFPMLPKWLVFFITSRPEDTVQFRLKKYNPCIKICAGNSENLRLYRQHERDIELFLEKNVDFSSFPFSACDVAKKCKGMFLCAYYIVLDLNAVAHSGEIVQLDDVFQGDIQDYFLQNFKRVFEKIGEDLYKKLFGCAIVAPSPLPLTLISFILEKEKSNLKEWKVIDALSTFVVVRKSDNSFDFPHNLIPLLLTEKESSRELFIDRDEASEYFRGVVVEVLSAAIEHQQWKKPSAGKVLLNYFVRVGVRFLCGYQDTDSLNIVFNCLTCFQFLWKRIERKGIEIYAVIADLKLSLGCHGLSDEQKEVLQEICLALESNIYVLLECQHLLHFCLRNTSQTVQWQLKIPAAVSNIGMECNWLRCHPCRIPDGTCCFALSPNKKFLAVGRQRDSPIYLLDACTLEKVRESIVVEEIGHLEFTLDSNFLFFGWLNKMFSLVEGCVKELPQFAGNNYCYLWGSFIFDDQYIIVEPNSSRMSHGYFCLVEIFSLWAAHEMQRMDCLETEDLCNLVEKVGFGYFLERLRVGFFKYITEGLLCNECLSWRQRHQEASTSLVRQRVIDLYAEMFLYQVWNIKTGRPVLEEAFSADVPLNPFFYLCHLTYLPDLIKIANADVLNRFLTPFGVAILNAAFFLEGRESRRRWRFELYEELKRFCKTPLMPDFIRHAPIEFQNCPTLRWSRITEDRKWIAVIMPDPGSKICKLFKRVDERENFNFQNPSCIVLEVNHFDFTDDSSVLLYITTNNSLVALTLKTGNMLSSVSGLIPLHLRPENQAGFLFRGQEGKKIIFLKDFPANLLKFLSFSSGAEETEVAFSSFDNQDFLEDPSVFLKETVTADSVLPSCQSSLVNHGTKYIFCFSAVGIKLVAREKGSKILLFNGDKGTPVVVREGDRKGTVTFLKFSVDGALLLFCTESPACLLVWDVQLNVLKACFNSPLGSQPVHCWCFSRDEKKLIICSAFQISIFEYDKCSLSLLAILDPPGPFREFDKFTHCTVSSDNGALACCITDRILVHAFKTPKERSLMELPRGHFGRIEFCQFLKERRYLISYGVDCTVFLWDLGEWKAAAFARVAQGRESILSMAVSPSEDWVVCLTTFQRFVVIHLFGLVIDKPKEFPISMSTTNKEMTSVTSSRRFDRRKDPASKKSGQFSNDLEPIDLTEYFEDMNMSVDENLESEDDLNDFEEMNVRVDENMESEDDLNNDHQYFD